MGTTQAGIPMFTGVMKGYPAHLAGIKQGDVVMKVDGEDVTTLS
ncbi:MAG: PDZ domain-containing protein, partial [Anaerolineae bacterium]|nr:PDZ domain-containing protein [Anaerolineae bacterium]